MPLSDFLYYSIGRTLYFVREVFFHFFLSRSRFPGLYFSVLALNVFVSIYRIPTRNSGLLL